MYTFILKVLLTIVYFQFQFCLTTTEDCEYLNTLGHSYEKIFKVTNDNYNNVILDFDLKAESDGLLMFTSSPDTIQHEYYYGGLQKSAPTIEIVIGGGKNTFSQIRTGTVKLQTRLHVSTPGILSPTNFRSFSLKITPSSSSTIMNIEVTRKDNNTTFLSWSTSYFPVKWFGLSSWTKVRGQWRFNCAGTNTTRELLEETDFKYKGLAKLKRDLIMFYEPSTMDNQMEVQVGVQINRVHLNEKLAKVLASGKMFLAWVDDKLSWFPKDYDNITSLHVAPEEIWTPQLYLYTGISDVEFIVPYTANCLVQYNGLITWMPAIDIKSYCHLEMEKWPHDAHNCSFLISVFGLASHYLNPQNISLTAGPSNQWMANTTALEWNVELTTPIASDDFYIVIYLYLTRKDSSFNTIFQSPFICAVIMTLSSFWLKPDDPTKLYLFCISMVILSLFHIHIGEMMPVTSLATPPIITLYNWSMIMTSLSIVHFVLVKNVNRFEIQLPQWCRTARKNPLLGIMLCAYEPEITNSSTLTYEDLVLSERTFKDTIHLTVTMERAAFMLYLITFTCIYVNEYFLRQ